MRRVRHGGVWLSGVLCGVLCGVWLCGVLAGGAARASDHLDGPDIAHQRKADASDLYTWTPTPGRLVVGLMTRPLSGKRARFDDGVTHRLLLRRAELSGPGAGLTVQTGDALTITCQGERGRKRAEDRMHCSIEGPLGARTVQATVGRVEGAAGEDLRLFAGPRRDPFFIDTGKISRDHPRDGERRPRRGRDTLVNPLIRSKVLAVVVELDVAAFFGDAPGLLAVAAETDLDGVRVDRVARPELTGFVLASKWGVGIPGEDVRDAWNADRSFDLSAGHRPAYEAAMAAGLARLDDLDRFADPRDARGRDPGPGLGPDWPSPHPLAALLLDDLLLVDPARACTVETPSLFEIELAWLRALPPDDAGDRHQTCGGRPPNIDAVDVVLTLFINGPDRVPPGPPFYGPPAAHAPLRGDGVDRPRTAAASTFPYFQAP